MNINDIIDEITLICRRNNVSELYLFGSYAKNTNQERSDIDIIVDGNYDYNKLSDEIDDIMTLKKIDIFEKKNIVYNKYIKGDFDKYARRIY